jgi:hypothetical protein
METARYHSGIRTTGKAPESDAQSSSFSGVRVHVAFLGDHVYPRGVDMSTRGPQNPSTPNPKIHTAFSYVCNFFAHSLQAQEP